MDRFFEIIKNNLSVVRPWQDAIDIIIITIIIYKIIQLVRDSSAGRVLKGVIVFVVATQIAGFLQLNVLHYLLSSTMQIGILALVVLFAPELRRMLDSMGRSRITDILIPDREQGGGGDLRTVTTLVEVCTYFSRTKTGALIVIERDTKLGDRMKNGIILHAEISSELLKNIFYDKAPLHDGAVIIRGNTIAAAGCMMPMSENSNLSSDLGMRHRAGVGTSEVSDALVLIVSEETGSISVAQNGVLKRKLSPESLSAILMKELIRDEGKKSGLDKLKFWRSREK